MRTTTRSAGLFLPLALLTLTGCGGLGRETTVLEQYVLTGPPPEAAGASSDRTGVTLGVRRLDLAPYLASPAIVVRRGDHQIVTSEFHRWGESPAEGITRALAGYLGAAPPVRAVDVAPWPARSEHDYLIKIHVSRFEGALPEDPLTTEGEARVTAAWEILGGRSGLVLARGATDFREGGWSVGDWAGLVMRLDGGLATLGRDLVACLGRLPSGSAGSEPPDGEAAAPVLPVVAC